MRTQAHELQHHITRFSVDQHKVKPDVTISMVFPFASQRMVAMLLGRRLVTGQGLHYLDEIVFQRYPILAFGFALVVTFEPIGVFNLSH